MSVADDLKRLDELRKSGALSEEEFQTAIFVCSMTNSGSSPF